MIDPQDVKQFLEEVVAELPCESTAFYYPICCEEHVELSAMLLATLFSSWESWRSTPPPPTWDPSKPPTLDSHEYALRLWDPMGAPEFGPGGLPGTGFDVIHRQTTTRIDRRFQR